MVRAFGDDVKPEDVVVVIVFAIEQTLSFGAGVTITEDVAKNAFAESYKTTEDKVDVTITALRRLQGPSFLERHLAAGTDVKARIRTVNAQEADRMNAIGANTTAIEKDFKNNYEAYQFHAVPASAAITVFVWMYSSSPTWPSSRPKPLCFFPPKGVFGNSGWEQFVQTTPLPSRLATRSARSTSAVMTALPRPYTHI